MEYTLDEEGRLHTMVYMSRQGQCIVQMRHWNDVLTIDATHKTNRYRFCTCMEALSITARLAHVIAAFCCTCTSTLLHHSHRWNMVVVLICLIGPNGRTMHIGDLIMRSEAAENYTTAFQLLDLCAGCPSAPMPKLSLPTAFLRTTSLCRIPSLTRTIAVVVGTCNNSSRSTFRQRWARIGRCFGSTSGKQCTPRR